MNPETLEASARRDLLHLDRRGFLRAAALAAGAGLVPTGCGGAPAVWAPPASSRLRFLTPRTWAVLSATSERMVGEPGGALIRDRRVLPGAHVETFLAGSPDLAGALSQALLAVEFAPWPLLPKVRPFTSLDARARSAVLADLRDSAIALKRALFRGLKSLSLLGFYASRESHALVAYPMLTGVPDVAIEDAMS